jgi:hypothetical protein
MIIRKTIEINAPLSVVWRVFSCMEDWQQWNEVCRNCCYIEGDEMALHTCFAFEVAPLYFPLRVEPRITKCEPGREVVWTGGRLGIRAEHRFRFDDLDGRVQLLSEEEFKGPMVLVARLLRVPQRLHRLTGKFMQAIKSRAESCAASP